MNGNSDENKIREAFEEVRLPEGAKERMYANILQKAELAKANASSQIEEAPQQSAAQLQETSQALSQTAPQLRESMQSTEREAIPAAKAAKMTPSKRSARLSWRKYMSLAACLVIFIAAGTFLPGILDDDSVGGDTTVTPPASEAPLLSESPQATESPESTETLEAAQAPQSSDSTPNSEASGGSQNPQKGENSADDEDITLSPSPFEEVTSAEDFSKALGFSIDAPEGAEDVSYSVAFGETAIVDFSFANHAYTYYASKNGADLSADSDSKDTLCQTWENGGINYLLLNTDGASKEEFEEVVAALQNS